MVHQFLAGSPQQRVALITEGPKQFRPPWETTAPENASPTLYEQSMSSLKRLGDGAYGLSSLSEKRKKFKFKHLQMSFQRKQFILSVSDC